MSAPARRIIVTYSVDDRLWLALTLRGYCVPEKGATDRGIVTLQMKTFETELAREFDRDVEERRHEGGKTESKERNSPEGGRRPFSWWSIGGDEIIAANEAATEILRTEGLESMWLTIRTDASRPLRSGVAALCRELVECLDLSRADSERKLTRRLEANRQASPNLSKDLPRVLSRAWHYPQVFPAGLSSMEVPLQVGRSETQQRLIRRSRLALTVTVEALRPRACQNQPGCARRQDRRRCGLALDSWRR